MKINNLLSICCLSFVLFLTTGCVEEFLTREPISDLTEGNFFQTGADAEAALVAAYDSFQNEFYIFDRFTNGDVISDNCYAGGDNPNNFQLDQFTLVPTNANVERDWSYLYEGISRASAVLDNIGDIESPDFTNERREEMLGEASFLRAMHYFHLVNLYGGVPLVLQKVNSTDPEEVNVPRSTEAEVYEGIISDLRFALSRVPEEYPGDDQRVTKGAVNALLAKAYTHQPTPDWANVKIHADAVINSGRYSLLPIFRDLWNGQNENSAESLFEVQYIGGTNEANWGPQLWLPPSITNDNWRKFNTPSKDLIAAFNEENDNIRLGGSIIFENNLPWQDPDYPSGNIPFPYKQNLANGWSSPNNLILLRLADIILLAAEAETELNNLGAAADLLNQVRERVNLPAFTTGNIDEMRDKIATERRLELAFEGHRWYDLKRIGKAVEVMNNLNRDYNVTATHLLWPIPQAEMDRNPTLEQNPGF